MDTTHRGTEEQTDKPEGADLATILEMLGVSTLSLDTARRVLCGEDLANAA